MKSALRMDRKVSLGPLQYRQFLHFRGEVLGFKKCGKLNMFEKPNSKGTLKIVKRGKKNQVLIKC